MLFIVLNSGICTAQSFLQLRIFSRNEILVKLLSESFREKQNFTVYRIVKNTAYKVFWGFYCFKKVERKTREYSFIKIYLIPI